MVLLGVDFTLPFNEGGSMVQAHSVSTFSLSIGSNTMFSLTKDKNNIVKKLTFNKPLHYYYLPNNWDMIHEDMAQQFAKMPWNYATAIVQTEPLAQKLWDDPRHAHISYTTLCSEVEERAREQAGDHFFSDSQIADIFKKNRFPKNRYNWEEEGEVDDEKPIEIELKDAIYDAQVKMLYPEIVEEFKEECRYEYDEKTEEEVKLAPKAFAKKWKKRQLEIFLPRVDERSQRAFPNTPEPFDHSTSFTQYFFIEKEDKVEWIL